eukprot:CAMPEP_0114609676 /NCGR_PEP_ID=MMETSP0168-20121206/3209_1 /TAXON_ID=95228 ORGANISM="Vannella sp., Strain DIVA3 517/6/12" /NCGR_SAMPLE_ID=MMETSP0168 /ASSEMBLY_ACC=CAM_ASM_000044 /LENGTH=551 /DNA_ID=CAMNT_0001820597 /DNA_START=55 /DNA_END=1706 /DNA_ORIENTATION=-
MIRATLFTGRGLAQAPLRLNTARAASGGIYGAFAPSSQRQRNAWNGATAMRQQQLREFCTRHALTSAKEAMGECRREKSTASASRQAPVAVMEPMGESRREKSTALLPLQPPTVPGEPLCEGKREKSTASVSSTDTIAPSVAAREAVLQKQLEKAAHARQEAASKENGEGEKTEEHEVADPDLIFQKVWNKMEHKYGLEKMQFPEESIFLMGAPGSGKGTHSEYIRKLRGLTSEPVVISDLLNSPEAAALKSKAELVADGTVLELLLEHLLKPQYENGVIIDGFPRTHKQVAFVNALHRKIHELHKHFLGTEYAEKFTRPRFRMAVLFISENTSIERQLARGERTKAHNEEVEKTGKGEKWELRETDVSEAAAAKRYKVFTDHYSTLFSLRETFAFKLVEADASIEEVQERLAQEFEYQGSLELAEDTFEALCKMPLASELSVHTRQKLIERLDGYQHQHADDFHAVLDVLREQFLPIIQVHAPAGYCIIRSDSPVFSKRIGRSMALDILTERGFHVTVDVIKDRVLESITMDNGQPQPVYEVSKVHVFHV